MDLDLPQFRACGQLYSLLRLERFCAPYFFQGEQLFFDLDGLKVRRKNAFFIRDIKLYTLLDV